jgi:hypothetical protein
MPKLRECLGLKIRIKIFCGIGGPGGTKKWVPPVWSEGTVGVCRKNLKEIVLIFVVLS